MRSSWEVSLKAESVKRCTSSIGDITLQVLHWIKKLLKAFYFLFPAGLTILDMKVLDFYWMYWKSFWTRNSKDLDLLKGGVGELVKIVCTYVVFLLPFKAGKY